MTEPIDFNKLSPVAIWRDWVAKSEAQWSQSLSGMLKDERASGALNRQIDEARMMQRMFAEFAQGSLAMANMPSRSDIEGIDERLGRVEDGLAALSAEITRMREALGPRVAAPVPDRTRKPPVAPTVPAANPAPKNASQSAPTKAPQKAPKKVSKKTPGAR